MNYEELNLNGYAIGDIMKEVIRRLILIIQPNRFKFEIETKMCYSGEMDD